MTHLEKDIEREIKVKESNIRMLSARKCRQNQIALPLVRMQVQQLKNALTCIKDAMALSV